jgi:VanZ family protein
MNKYLRYWLPLFAYCVFIFILSSSPKPFPSLQGAWNDKLLHTAEYAILGFITARAIISLNLRYSKGFLLILAIILCSLYGLSDEIHQALVPGRIASVGDIVADGFGSLIGAFCYSRMLSKQ